MTPGIIKKLYHTTPVGLTDEDKQEVYPITATSAVYSAPGESSFPNMSLDNILDALNQGYQYMGKATPTTNPGVYNHKVFYLASDPGTYSYFGNIEVSSLTVLKTSGNGWTADVFNITGGGGGGTAAGYIGTTLVQSSPAPQNLGGISQLNLTSGARIYFGETAYIELNQYGFHFSHGIYSDSFVAAGGIGSSGGGGGGVSNLSELDDVYHNNIGVLRADGTAVQPGDALIYNTTLGWVAAPVSGGGGSGTVTGIKMNGTTLSPSTTGIVDLGTVITSLSGYATEQWVSQQGFLTSASLSGYATQNWVQQQNYLTSHQAISTLTLNAGSFTAGTWTPTGNGTSFNIPTTLDHISDGTSRKLSDYVTLATAQTITGAKTFTTNPVTIGQTSSLSMHQSSYIDIGPIRIKFENNAIHITKVSSSDTTSYGLYADGFISAGGVAAS